MSHNRSLAGKTVLITRGEQQAKEFAEKIEALGGQPISIPLISFQLPENREAVKVALSQLPSYDWIIFTSQNGVEYFFQLLQEENIAVSKMPQIAAVGEKTEQALKHRGVKVDLVPPEFVAESLAEAMKPFVNKGTKILFPRGNLARTVLRNELHKQGADVTDIIVYENIPNEEAAKKLPVMLEQNELDIITFTSSSTVRNFAALIEQTGLKEKIAHTIIACIGPITKKTAIQLGLPVHVCPEKHYTIEGMLEEIVAFVKKEEEKI
jgi:uroporphyrinogen-III synthase